MRLFPQLRIVSNTHVGNRVIDYQVRFGNNVINLEAKYGLPWRRGEALSRLVGQMQAMAGRVQEQPIVWTLQSPTLPQLRMLERAVGTEVFSRTQLIHGVAGLYQYFTLVVGLP